MANDKEITQRRQVRCAACKEDFSYIIRVKQAQLEQPELFVKVTCPFCGAKLRVDISPWRRRIVTSHKVISDEQAGEGEWGLTDLPDELPSQPQAD